MGLPLPFSIGVCFLTWSGSDYWLEGLALEGVPLVVDVCILNSLSFMSLSWNSFKAKSIWFSLSVSSIAVLNWFNCLFSS